MLVYKTMKVLAGCVATVLFNRKYLRNEIKGKSGAMVILGNHEAALDFTTLVSATKRPITFVVSDSFYNTLPFRKFMKMIGVIPKQQFQTTINEIARMRSVIKDDGILMFYPSGLMSKDGLETPIPSHTHKFLQWLGADVYAARTSGTYFCTPKWSGKIRPGRTYMDIYKIIDKDELHDMTEEQIRERVEGALSFDAYREQEKLMVKYLGCENIEGLEHVLYICPHCKKEFSISVRDKSTLYCTECGFAHTSDKYGFLHNTGTTPEEIRYVSDWSRAIYDQTREMIESGELSELSSKATIQTIDLDKKKYVDVGYGTVTLTREHFVVEGTINGEDTKIEVPLCNFASIPYKPGCRIEVQHNHITYRCVLEDGKLASKFVYMVENFYQAKQCDKTEEIIKATV